MKKLLWAIGRARCKKDAVRKALALAAAMGIVATLAGCAWRAPDRLRDGKAIWFSAEEKPIEPPPRTPGR